MLFHQEGANKLAAQCTADGGSAVGVNGTGRVWNYHHAQYATQLLTGRSDRSAGQDS